jgi:hypothetical protein
MLLQFETIDVRRVCEDEASAVAELGEEAQALFAVLSDLRAAKNLREVPPSVLEFDPDDPTRFYAQLDTSRLALTQNMQNMPLDEYGHLRLDEVIRVRVMQILR